MAALNTDHINCPVRPRVTLDDADEPLEMIGFTIARYKFACKWMRSSDHVLEAGCGEGFGCNFFSSHVAAVTGLDVDGDVIERCRGRYVRSNLQFVVGDIVHPADPPRPQYDAVVSFEMIEHVGLADGQKMAAHCAGHLKRA